MTIQYDYDKEIDTLYLSFKPIKEHLTELQSENFIINIDGEGTIQQVLIQDATQFLRQAAEAGVPVGNAHEPTWESVDSSMISAFKYYPETEILEVMFNRSGVYEYVGVPSDVVDGLRNSSSKGRYMRSMIIGVYD